MRLRSGTGRRTRISSTVPAALLLLTGAFADREAVADAFPDASADVSFDAVLSLPSDDPDQVISYGTSPSQFVELWRVANPVGKTPVVAFIHGGCWLSEYSIDHSHPLATALIHEGFAVWNIEYRRAGETGGGFPASLDDVRAALAMLRDSPPPGLDPHRMVVAGHSAGGHLALLAAGGTPTIALAPIVDIADYARGSGSCNAGALAFMGAAPEQKPEAYRAATPALRASDTVLMGALDRIVPPQAALLPPAVKKWPDAGHFDWIHPGTPAWKLWLSVLRSTLECRPSDSDPGDQTWPTSRAHCP